MRLLLTGRNVEITPALRQLVTRRVGKFERLLQDSAVSVQVVLAREKYRHLTDVTLHARGDNVLSAVGAATTWSLSLKEAVDNVAQQALRVKEKWQTRKRRGASEKHLEPAPVAAPAPAAPQPPLARVVRTRYPVRRLAVADAAARVEVGPDPFLLFRDEVSGRLALVMRRKDGQIGLIEPEA